MKKEHEKAENDGTDIERTVTTQKDSV